MNINDANLSAIVDNDNSNVGLLNVDSSYFNEEENMYHDKTFIIEEGVTSNNAEHNDETLDILNSNEIDSSSNPDSTFCENNNPSTATFIKEKETIHDTMLVEEKIIPETTFTEQEELMPETTFTVQEKEIIPETTITEEENIPDATFILNKNDMLVEMVALLVKKKKPKDAVQFLSLFCATGMKHEEAEMAIGRKIHSKEWANANKHCLFPGAGEPPQKSFWKFYRQRVSDSHLVEFMEWLKPAGLIQSLSFGQKLVRYSNGLYIPIESVKRTDSVRNVVRKYYHHFLEDRDFDCDENEQEEIDLEQDGENDDVYELERDSNDYRRCSCRCKKTGRQCYLSSNHVGRHKYTPKHLLSPSTIEKLIKELTSGSITSRAGLDNIYVEKGTENFEGMRSIVETLSTFANWNIEKKEEIRCQIDSIEEFHKTYFEKHLLQSENKHICMCIHCGFHDGRQDNISCPGNHKAFPCKSCQDSFQVFDVMRILLEIVKSTFLGGKIFDNRPELEDDLMMWEENIKIFESNLIDFRAHLAQKVSEEKFDQSNNVLLESECLCIIDYKMRVLPMSYREKMTDWFSKRGISILGVELHIMVNGKRKVFYHFLISDDANQNTETVLCAKHFLYKEVFPKYGIKNVKFRSDGGACFSSNDAKAAMKVWFDLFQEIGAGKCCYESSYKVMVSGCGKTALDGKSTSMYCYSNICSPNLTN